MFDLFRREGRTRAYPYVQNVTFWEGPRRLDWRVEFALLVVKTLTVAAILVVAALVALLPDSNLRSLLGGRQAAPSMVAKGGMY